MKNEVKLIAPYFAKYKWRLVIGFICLIIVDGLQIFIPWLIRSAVDILANGGSHKALVPIGVYILLLAIGIGVTRFIWRYCIIGLSRIIEEDLRNRFFKHLINLSFSFFDRKPVGDLMALATNDLEAVRMMIGMGIVASADAALLMAASLIMMFSINPLLTLYVLIPLPIVTLTVLRLGPRLHKRFKDVQAGFSALTRKAQETFSGIRVVKSFVQELHEVENFRKLNATYVDRNLKLVLVWGLLHPIIWVISGSCMVIILIVGGSDVISGKISIGDFVAFNSYLGILVWPMIAVGWVVNLYQRGRASLGRLYKIFQIQPEIRDAEDSESGRIKGHITFRNLCFSYENGIEVLSDINLDIPAGQWLAVMGPTGSSKSTLVQMIPRLYDVKPGMLFIDDRDVVKWRLADLRSQIGFVPQQTFLFSDTLADNIRFGSDLSEQEIKNLAVAAGIYKDVESFPDGFETLVGEKGVTLSGGQKQRVAIARTLGADAPIMIFDDALSAVDSETEEQIMRELTEKAGKKTVIFVTHRVSTAQCADKIVFMDQGRIVEYGTHEELVTLRGKYFGIYEHQRLMEELSRELDVEESFAGGNR